MSATWKNTKNRSGSGWDVVNVYSTSYDGILCHQGRDNTRPDENRHQTEKRLSEKFGIKPDKMTIEIVG